MKGIALSWTSWDQAPSPEGVINQSVLLSGRTAAYAEVESTGQVLEYQDSRLTFAIN